jgi:hypothetical protein
MNVGMHSDGCRSSERIFHGGVKNAGQRPQTEGKTRKGFCNGGQNDRKEPGGS